MESRQCQRCFHLTFFSQIKKIKHQNKIITISYCPKCWLYINLSAWKCERCKTSGTQRIMTNFFNAILICLGIRNVYQRCICGNKCELTKQ